MTATGSGVPTWISTRTTAKSPRHRPFTDARARNGRLHAQAQQIHAIRRRSGGRHAGRINRFTRDRFGRAVTIDHRGGTTFPVVISRNAGNTFMPTAPAVHIAGKAGAWQCHGVWRLQKQTVAVTWVKSLGINTGLNFQASVQTGYDDSASITYTFLYNGNQCGTDGTPGRHPRQLVVRSAAGS
jgi:hypothetical protein